MGKKEKDVKGNNKFACSSCDKKFKYESEKIRHEQSHTLLFPCKVCNKTFNFVSALKRHEKQHNRSGSVECKECGRRFRDDTLLKRHEKYSHTGSYTCAKCLAVFPSGQALATHEKTHRAGAERPYRCRHDGCDKSFNFPHHLKHHELTHSDTKQHYCNVCGKGFIQLYHLKSHLKNHVPDEWLVCEIAGCKKRFATDYALKRHLATHKQKFGARILSVTPSNGTIHGNESEDCVLCPVCGELVSAKKMAKHSVKCTKLEKESTSKDKCTDQITLTKEDLNNDIFVLNNETQALKDDGNCNKDLKQTYKHNEVANSCKTALGGCLAREEPNGTCLCEQITGDIGDYNEQLDMMITETTEIATSENTTLMFEELNSYKTMDNQCENCADSATCGDFDYKSAIKSREPEKCCNFKKIRTMPEIEFRLDGVIKLSETFDKHIRFPFNTDANVLEAEAKSNTDMQVPYNSCKSVLGNCIVSGNDTIGEGCFCARMGIEAQLATAQEIEEITIFNEAWSS